MGLPLPPPHTDSRALQVGIHATETNCTCPISRSSRPATLYLTNSMALFIDRARTRTHHPSLRFYGHLKPMIPPLSSRGSPPLYICYIQDSISHTLHMLHFLIDPPKKTLKNSHTITLQVCISLTQPHAGGVRIQEENRCTMHVLTLRAQPHPRGYTVEFISLRNGSPRANLNACSGCLPTEAVYHACTKQSST